MNEGFKHNIEGEIEYLTIPSFEETNIIKHCFTTRLGGVSINECKSLNMGFNRNDSKENVLENYKRICNVIGVDYRGLVFSKQIHENNILNVGIEDKGKGIIKDSDIKGIDGLITNHIDVPLVTFYADCVPIFFLDSKNKVIGLAHSGWRGTVKRISHNMILKMTKEFGCQKKDIIVGIGPSIGKCHFEVDEPVYNEFYKSFGENIKKICIRGNHEKYYIDLWKANEIVLREAGIIKRNITLANECTYCNEKLYYSHRRDKGKTGSLVAILQLK